jgi:hypothetical protein
MLNRPIIVVLLAILLVGCSNTTSPELSSTQTFDANTQGVSATNTADPTTGRVEGCLKINGEAVERLNLYLAPILKDNAGKEIVAALERTTDPGAVSDKNGCFSFINVPVGSYALLYEVGTMGNMIMDKNGVSSLILRVQAGDVIDLGQISASQ